MVFISHKRWAVVIGGLLLGLLIGLTGSTAHAAYNISDQSEWQGSYSYTQAKNLKGEMPFTISRVQYGSAYADKVFDHNAKLFNEVKLPLAVYSFSQYTSTSDARNEARVLYQRSKAYHPIAYINDAEVNTVTSGTMTSATIAWAKEMRKLTNKPIILYSYRPFYVANINTTKGYDAFWLASYGDTPSPHDYALWQYTDHHYFSAIGASVDASTLITNKKPLSFWLGKNNANRNEQAFVAGGFKTGQQVILNPTATHYFNPTTKIDDTSKGHAYTIKQTVSVQKGHSKQAVLLAKDDQTIGWVLAQDVHYPNHYYTSVPSTKTVQLLQTVKKYANPNFGGNKGYAKKGTILHVKDVVKRTGASYTFKLDDGSYITANQAYVQMTAAWLLSMGSHQYAQTTTGVHVYKDANLKHRINGKGYTKGKTFKVVKVVTRKNGGYSLKLSNGRYVTAYRGNVGFAN